MRIFLDFEFIEDGKTIEPISVGMVREDNEEYYAEFLETDLSKANPWVVENVIPNLKTLVLVDTDVQVGPLDEETLFPIAVSWGQGYGGYLKGTEQIKKELLEFCGESPEFWGYFCDYDWVTLCQMWGPMLARPQHWPMYCLDLKQEMHQIGTELESIEAYAPQPTTHNALEDARWVSKAYYIVVT